MYSRQDKSFMRDPSTLNCRIYVGNLDDSVQNDKLEEHFKKHGNILGVVVQRGFGFIQFEQESSAQEAIEKEHGVLFMGKKLNVRQAIDNKNKNAGNQSQQQQQPSQQGQQQQQQQRQQQQQAQQQPSQQQQQQQQQNSINESPIAPKLKQNPPMKQDGPPRKIRRGTRGGGRNNQQGAKVEADDRDYRDGPYYNRDEYQQNTPYIPPVSVDRNHGPSERNDCEIIVVSKTLTEYAEYIEHRLKSIGLTVDLLFPNEDVPIGRVLANISSRGCLYAVLVMPINEEHRSFTLNILYGIPQEHRNMPVDDAVAFIARNFETYMRGEKSGHSSNIAIAPAPIAAERHPEAIQILLNLLADNRQLTTLQYDRIIKYLQEKREHQYKQEVGEVQEIAQNQEKETELQNRIMSILNKTGASPTAPTPTILAPSITAAAVQVQPKSSAPILNDPSVQKALDSLLQGDILKSISSNRF